MLNDSRLLGDLRTISLGLFGGIVAISAWRYYESNVRWRLVARRRKLAMEAGSPELEKMLSGKEYVATEGGLQEIIQSSHALCEEFNSPGRSVAQRRQIALRLLGSNKGCTKQHGETRSTSPPYIEPPFYCDYGFNVSVGDNFYANFGCILLDVAEIKLGNNCFLAPGVKIYTATHPLDAVRRRTVEFALPVEIGDDVWIGGDAVVCPGVKVGSRVVIAAGSVVTQDVPDDVLVAGVPATVKRKLL